MMYLEIWKDIEGYEGHYEISNFGVVRSIDRYIPNTNGVGVRLIKGKVIEGSVNNSGYRMVVLKRDNKPKGFLVHRLVAIQFIDNHKKLSDVNHKDEDKLNNKVSNLEWISHKDNINYGNRNLNASKKLKGTRTLSSNGKSSKVTNLNTLKIFDTILEASYFYNINKAGISACCRCKTDTCGGYKWMYYNDYLNMITLGEVIV